ncbi:MAG: PAS domain S-box protein, partial [Planctomycetota bacterium]|nr:PAS domain S-box protein [Planctomycetota bacterium]
LRTLVDTALDAVVTCDTDSVILDWNGEAEELFGWTRAEALGRRLTDTIVPPDLREAHAAGMRRYLDTGEGPVLGRRIEIEAVDRDGRRFPVELGINPIPTNSGLRFSAFLRDISERVAQEQRLVGSEYRLRGALAAMEAGAWDYRLDDQGGLVEAIADERSKELLGDDALLLPGFRASIHEEDRPKVAEAWRRHLAGETPRFSTQYRWIGPDGGQSWIRELANRVVGEEEVEHFAGQLRAPRRVIGIVEDITAAKTLETSLVDARKLEAVGTVASQFAHDLNNMLTAISGHVSLAEIVSGIPERALASLEVIKGAVTRGRAITQNMLQLGRPQQSGRRPAEVDVRRLVEETTRLASPILGEDIRLETVVEASEPFVFGDGGQIQQGLLNLLINARDAMQGKGSIRVSILNRPGSAEDESDWIVFEVVDDGPGMTPEILEKASQPFFSTKGEKGTGLGLSMLRGLMEAEKGRLELESRVGAGTTVRMVFPARTGTVVREARPAVGRVRRVLVVEDHPLRRPRLAEALGHAGCKVDACGNGEEALELAERETPDIVVVDVNLPGMRGDQIAARIRELHAPGVPVVFITGNNDFETPDGSGIQLIRKPFELTEFTEVVLGGLRS